MHSKDVCGTAANLRGPQDAHVEGRTHEFCVSPERLSAVFLAVVDDEVPEDVEVAWEPALDARDGMRVEPAHVASPCAAGGDAANVLRERDAGRVCEHTEPCRHVDCCRSEKEVGEHGREQQRLGNRVQ